METFLKDMTFSNTFSALVLKYLLSNIKIKYMINIEGNEDAELLRRNL
jgi:hypothetical protein